MLIMIDNYDSFVYNLVRYFEELGEEIKVFRNDVIDEDTINSLNPKGIIISPGPKSPKEAGNVLEIIDKFKEKMPILGICLGHQSIGEYFKCDIVKGVRPMHGKITKITTDEEGIFKGIKKEFKVTRYHSLVIDESTISKELKITANSEDGAIMGVKHKTLPIYGVQYHPEAELTEFGYDVLKNFIDICNL
ncbi:MAG: anthranilate synthase component II [Clostridium sp.]